MDPAVHARFLEYLEIARSYQRKGEPRLDAAGFTALDAEHEALAARDRARVRLDAAERARLRELRKLLHLD